MEKEVETKVSLVTGASSGLGRVIAEMLCEKKHIVYVTARRKALLDELKKQCEDLGGKMEVISGDLSDPKFRIDLISKIIKKQGKIDYLINNAGFGRSSQFEIQKAEEIQKMFEVNVVAYQHLTNLILPYMKKRNQGRLIHIGSVVAFTPLPYFTTYNSTKAAVYAFNRSLRYELKDSKVTTTVVLPARMNTGFADKAYDCYKTKGRDMCVKEFNKIAGSPYPVAKNIVNNLDSGKEVITPTFKAKLWYFTRYAAWLVDLSMKNILGPKELKHIQQAGLKNNKEPKREK